MRDPKNYQIRFFIPQPDQENNLRIFHFYIKLQDSRYMKQIVMKI